jgi:hypothetical protein
MPATLSEAYISPFHTYTSPSSDGYTDSTASIRNPRASVPSVQPTNYNAYAAAPTPSQMAGYYAPQTNYKISDIKSEADDIKSIYGTLNSESSHSMRESKHDCNYLIAKLLSCATCRKKIRKLLSQDEEEHVPKQQKGGGLTDMFSDSLITNILIGVAILYVIDRILLAR